MPRFWQRYRLPANPNPFPKDDTNLSLCQLIIDLISCLAGSGKRQLANRQYGRWKPIRDRIGSPRPQRRRSRPSQSRDCGVRVRDSRLRLWDCPDDGYPDLNVRLFLFFQSQCENRTVDAGFGEPEDTSTCRIHQPPGDVDRLWEEARDQGKVAANMSKSRNEKFHKLFKNIPEVEHVLKCYLCAYVGDILLQGYFYILPSYFCFYTKILGHEKQLAIPVSEVLNITREKTALIIPNAIGILTNKDKYVFGSLMSRDSTYRLMCNVWKKKIPNAQNVKWILGQQYNSYCLSTITSTSSDTKLCQPKPLITGLASGGNEQTVVVVVVVEDGGAIVAVIEVAVVVVEDGGAIVAVIEVVKKILTKVTDLKASDSDSSTGQDYIVARDDLSSMDEDALPSSASGSDLSEGSPCSVCGLPMIEHDTECQRMDDNVKMLVTGSESMRCNGMISVKRPAVAGSDQTDHRESSSHRHHQSSQKISKQKLKQHATLPGQ
ncbi:hypothetical protein LSH36_58g08022 [Paralvinella palmiformis]|uniref:GRAM domain-containing protein n=1 Tax=Paralvinella palmiformis TaxID=53620 RepID=A0AAD9K5A8_9ANNE|nr:hypothetical protein LSH36_58g08022 [Paralvinella palmiformis]